MPFPRIPDLLFQHSELPSGGGRNPWARPAPVRQRPEPCGDDCAPSCPDCGGLQCLCRPRFFPGQLLTDDDLNRLQQYVIDKNKLQNRYLHGWGVACGLEVVCDGCDAEQVVVRPGYALSPCGDDIVVCRDTAVNICDLINACEPREPQCDPPYERAPKDCRRGQRRWVLAICYDERPTRGVTAQLGAGDTAHGSCGCGGSGSCGCGGSSGRKAGGCGCGGSSRAASGGTSCGCGGATASGNGKRKAYKPQCEPTQVCEGYRFVAYPAPEDAGWIDPIGGGGDRYADRLLAWAYANRARFGALLERVLCCVIKAMELRDAMKARQLNAKYDGVSVYLEYAAALADFAEDFAIHRCAFIAKAQALRDRANAYGRQVQVKGLYEIDNQAGRDAMALELEPRFAELDDVWSDIITQCFCSALLPACPRPVTGNCVPLAVVTLSRTGCAVEEICNWEERKLLISWPTISYWLSWVPWHRLKEVVASFCCGPDRRSTSLSLLTVVIGLVYAQQAKRKSTVADAEAMMAGAMTPPAAAPTPAPAAAPAPQGRKVATSALEADNMLSYVLDDFDRLRGAADLGATGHPVWASVAAKLAGGSAQDFVSSVRTKVPSITDLTARLDKAERDLKAQRKEIAELRKRK